MLVGRFIHYFNWIAYVLLRVIAFDWRAEWVRGSIDRLFLTDARLVESCDLGAVDRTQFRLQNAIDGVYAEILCKDAALGPQTVVFMT